MSDFNKRAAAEAAIDQVQDGMVVGLGTGSTAAFAVEALGRKVGQGLRITGVATSQSTEQLALRCGIPLVPLNGAVELDLTIDGADEIEPEALHLVKGRGGALLREKIVAEASRRLVIVADESKLVERLGRGAIPVEVVQFGWQTTECRLRDLGAKASLRMTPANGPFVTDSGNFILDCVFDGIPSPGELAGELDHVTGVVEHGLFLGIASEAIVAGPGGLRRLVVGS